MKKIILLIFAFLCPICFLTGCSYEDAKVLNKSVEPSYIENNTNVNTDFYSFDCVNSFSIPYGFRCFVLKHKYTNILYMYTNETGLSVLYDTNGLPLVFNGV